MWSFIGDALKVDVKKDDTSEKSDEKSEKSEKVDEKKKRQETKEKKKEETQLIKKAKRMNPYREEIENDDRCCLVCVLVVCCERLGLPEADYPWKQCPQCDNWFCYDCSRETRFTVHKKN